MIWAAETRRPLKDGETVMLDMDGCRFEYGNRMSFCDDYSLMFAHVDTEHVRVASGRKTGSFIFNKTSKSRYLVSDSYNDSSLEFDVEIVTCDGSILSLDSIRDIEKWLFVNSRFRKLTMAQVDQDEKYINWDTWSAYFNCRFLYPEKIESDSGVIGFKCVMQTDGMMMWNDKYVDIDFRSDVIVDMNTREIIIKGDADGDGIITDRDVQICKSIAAYGMLDASGNPVYTMSDFYNQDGTPVQENISILNLIQLPKTTINGITYITRDTMRRCLVACNPYITQEQYNMGGALGMDFCDIKNEYADLIKEKADLDSGNRGQVHKVIKLSGRESAKTLVFAPVSMDVDKSYAVWADSLFGDMDGAQLYLVASDNTTVISSRDLSDKTYDRWVINPMSYGGFKNLLMTNSGSGVQWFDIRQPIPPGDYILSFQNLTSTDTDSTTCRIGAFNSSNQNVSLYKQFERGDSTYREITITGDAAYIRITASDTTVNASGDTVSFSGAMLCTAQAWEESHQYVPYYPSNNCSIYVSSTNEFGASISFGKNTSSNTIVSSHDYVIKGDADGDGEISANDANICLKLYTWGMSGKTVSTYFEPILDEDDRVIGYTVKNENELNTLGLPTPVTYDSFIRCLIACDLSYTQADFDSIDDPDDQEHLGRLPDLSDISVDDAQNILKMYVQRVAQLPVDVDKIDVSGKNIVGKEVTRIVLANVDTDLDGYTYPQIIMSVGDIGGNIEIENTSDYREGSFVSSDRRTVIRNAAPRSVITIDSELNRLGGVGYNNMVKKFFPRLTNGENILEVKGDVASISIRWKYGILL